MSDKPLQLTRAQLAEFLPNARAVRVFEQLIKQTSDSIPTDLTAIKILVEEASTDAALGQAKANQALEAIQRIAQALEILATAPHQQQAADQLTIVTQGASKLTDLADVLVAVSTPGAALIFDSVTKRWKAVFLPQYITQVATPSATGFSVTIAPVVNSVPYNVWLLLKPTAGFAAGTIVLPVSTALFDQQEISVSCTQQVNALTVNGNGASVSGAPSVLAADSTFRLRYNSAANTWYRAE